MYFQGPYHSEHAILTHGPLNDRHVSMTSPFLAGHT